jgi:uncharacterized protein (TIGR02646 family)
MRPVDKGINNTAFKVYKDAKDDLLTRIGRYCSYCERKVSLAVEHINPKSVHASQTTDWDNFLLGCWNCNSTKGIKDPQTQDFLFPHTHNTAYAFCYDMGGRVRVNPALTDAEKQMAQDTLEMVGLDRVPPPDPQRKDDRWIDRREAWRIAEEEKQSLANGTTTRENILKLAVPTGFFSVWMTVFADDAQMCTLLIQAFPGTHPRCFDEGRVVSSLAFPLP